MQITTKQAADRLKCSESHVRTLAKRGELKPAAGGDGKHYRFELTDVREYAKTHPIVTTRSNGTLAVDVHPGRRLERIEEKLERLAHDVSALLAVWQ